MTQRELHSAFGVAIWRLERATHALIHAWRALLQRPTSLRAQRVGVLQLARERVNVDLGALNAIAASDADRLHALAFGTRRPRPKPRPRSDEEEESR